MPINKVHDIVDDAFSYPYADKMHLTRAGLMLNTIDKSKPVVITPDDTDRLMALVAEGDILSMDKARELGPITLQFDGQRDDKGRFIIGVLVVPMDEVSQIHCYPYSNNNEEQKMWPYDKHFMISNVGDLTKLNIVSRSTHPLAVGVDLDEAGSTHMSALSAMVIKTLVAFQQGAVELAQEGRDYSKLNKKRVSGKKSPVKPDYFLEWK